MGLELQVSGSEWELVWFAFETFFTVVFTAELVIKCKALGFRGMGIVRSVQLLRVLRMLKLLRQRRELMLILVGSVS